MGAGRRMGLTAVAVIALTLAGCTGGGDDVGAFCELLDEDLWARQNDGEPFDAIAFVDPEASADEVADLRDALDDDDEVVAATFSDQDATYEDFVELFADTPEMVEAVSPETLPARLFVELTDGDDASMKAFEGRYQGAPGVLRIVVPRDAVPGHTVLGAVFEPIAEPVGGVAVIGTAEPALWDDLIDAAPDEIRPDIETVHAAIEASPGASTLEVDPATAEAAAAVVEFHDANCVDD
jgi:FtsX extracellular domain